MKVFLIVGSRFAYNCGVVDYTLRLSESLKNSHFNVEQVAFSDLSYEDLSSNNNLIHIQYPSKAYGFTMPPQVYSVFFKSVVTLHEFSQASIFRRLLELPFLLFATRLIVTTEQERSAVIKYWPFCKSRVFVIPVFSAVSPLKPAPSVKDRDGICFFGLMRPNKGVEEFVQLIQFLQKHGSGNSIPVHIYTALPSGSEQFFEKIKDQAHGLEINWHVNKPLDVVSKGMLKMKYAYLHFPDGVTERRSSFMAAISHGITVLSNASDNTPETLKPAFLNANTPLEAYELLKKLEKNIEMCALTQAKGLKVASNYSEEKIVAMHQHVYKQLMVDAND